MRSFGRTMRGAASAMGLGLLTLGVATLVVAPAAVAQRGQPPQAIKQPKEFVAAFNAATAANAAKDWAALLVQADIMIATATDPTAKSTAYRFKLTAYANNGDKVGAISAIETLIGTGGLDPATTKSLKLNLASLYAETGNEAKAEELSKAYVAEYGGNSQQYGYLAQRALKAPNYEEAISYAQKAIEAAKTENKPADRFYDFKLTAYVQLKNMDAFYATLEEAAPLYPARNYFRPLIEKAVTAPTVNRQSIQLDLYRAFAAANVQLKPEEALGMAQAALARGMPIEAEVILQKSGASDPKLAATIQTAAKADRDGGLAGSEKEAASAPTGIVYVTTGEGYFGMGDYAKAADLIQKGLAKGGLKPEDEALARLHLGIAQYHAGQKDAAVATWTQIKADNGAEALARAWIAISKKV